MDNPPNSELERMVAEVARTWPPISSGDPNTVDLYSQAQKIQQMLGLQLPQTLPAKESGVILVELVEAHFVCASSRVLVRSLAPAAVAQRARNLVDFIYRTGLQRGGPPESYATALYTWHGCINMAKLLRPTCNVPGGQSAYSEQQRIQGHAWLQECWTRESARGNPWVRYGVSLPRPLEMNRKKSQFRLEVVEDWVPRDSPYWDR